MKIKTDFFLGTAFIIILSIAATAFVLANDARLMLKQEIGDKANLLINGIRGVAVESLIKKDLLSLNYFIKEAAATRGILYILVTDRNGNIAASNNPKDNGMHIAEAYPLIEPVTGTMDINISGTAHRALNFTEEMDIKNADKKITAGRIYVGFDRNYIENKMMMIYIKSAVIALIVMIIAVFLVMYMVGRITRPMKQLVDGTDVIAQGDLKHRIKVDVKNEFQSLANSFNSMTQKLDEYYEGILNAFTIAVDSKNKYTTGHSRRVSKYALALGRELKLGQQQLENIRIASILMDIGNLGVKDAVFTKTDSLTAEDFIQIQKHPEISAKILKNIPALNEVVPIIIQHHERHDGMGYPSGLKGDQISIEAKVLSLADAYDAMTTQREHRKALSMDEAVYELRNNKEKQFDPKVTEAFIGVINREGGAA